MLVLTGGGWWLAGQARQDQFSGWVTGLIPGEKGAVLVAINPVTNEARKILSLPEAIPGHWGDYGAVSPDGKYAAYTQWNREGTVRYLTVEKLGGKRSKRKYFSEVPQQEIIYLSWFPGGRRLLFVRSKREPHPNQEICVLDVKSGRLKRLVKGGEWDGRGVNDKDEWVDYMSQEELDQLIKKYGGPKSIPVEENGRKLWVEFSAPSISPDGRMIAYSATLFRDSCPLGKTLWLASSIWTVSARGGEPQRVYSNPEVESAIGRVVWSSDMKRLVFYRYRGTNGADGELDCLDLSTGKVKTIVPMTKEHNVNLNALILPDNEISFISVPFGGHSEDARRYIVNIDSGKIRPHKIRVDGKDVVMWNFSNLY
ncbi:MAG: TolB family protein [Thermodesulfitimonas sp.]